MLKKYNIKTWIFVAFVCLGGLVRLIYIYQNNKIINCLGEDVAQEVKVKKCWSYGDDSVCQLGGDNQAAHELISKKLELKYTYGNICEQARSLLRVTTGLELSPFSDCIGGLHPNGGVIVLLKTQEEVYAVRMAN